MSNDDTEKKRVDADLKPMPVQILAQYVKDFSYENPSAPDSLRASDQKPEMDVNLVLDAIKINDEALPDLYESAITLKVKSTRGNETLFIAEIVYAALIGLKDISPAQSKYILYVEVPQMLFPFARQMIASAVGAGGHPPLLLNPIDFRGMYENNIRNKKEAAA